MIDADVDLFKDRKVEDSVAEITRTRLPLLSGEQCAAICTVVVICCFKIFQQKLTEDLLFQSQIGIAAYVIFNHILIVIVVSGQL